MLSSPQVSRTPCIPIESKLSKAIYGLKKVQRAWYARLKKFLPEHKYVMGSVDKTLLTLKHATDFLHVQISWMISFSVALLTLMCPDFRK
jgi:hypothetical protein